MFGQAVFDLTREALYSFAHFRNRKPGLKREGAMGNSVTLEGFYFVSQIVTALGIMLSLIFVGLQVRQANEWGRKSNFHPEFVRFVEANLLDQALPEYFAPWIESKGEGESASQEAES